MYTSYIGKKFLDIYNQKHNKQISPKDFFCDYFFPLFFDNDTHLMHVGNSPFFQKVSAKDLVGGKSKNQVRLEKLHTAIEMDIPNMSIFVGYAARDIQGTTSGQVTDIDQKITSDEMYLSWIGESLSIGASGLVVSLDDTEVLYEIFEGAKYYREFLDKTPGLKDKQIETWNGHWFCHRFGDSFNPADPWSNFNVEYSEKENVTSIPTIKWTKLIFALAKKFPATEKVIYVYSLSQTNTTIGFIKVFLPQVRKLYELRDKIIIDKKGTRLTDKEIEMLEPFFNFQEACKYGSLGLKTLEPKGLREFLPLGTLQFAQGKEIKITDKNYNDFLIFKLWVIAMLNKTELLALAGKIASELIAADEAEKNTGRGKTIKGREAENIMASNSLKVFIENLTGFLSGDNSEVLKEAVTEVLVMPADNFPLFLALIKFEYSYQKLNGVKK